MEYWLNNYVEFEKKQNSPNRLVLNLTKIGGEKPQALKIYLPINVRIPTDFLLPEKADEIIQKLKDGELGHFPVARGDLKGFSVLSIEVPKDHSILKKIPGCFQKGNYDRVLRYQGMHPERKVVLGDKISNLSKDKSEIELENFDGFDFEDCFNASELRDLPYLVIDIEKPFWKSSWEKARIDLRRKYLKLEKKYAKLKSPEKEEIQAHEKRLSRISKLEIKLTTHIEKVGEVKLYDEIFDSDISFVGTIWGGGGKIRSKELYLIDPYDEIAQENYNGFKIIKFRNEGDLIRDLTKSIKERKPVISIGHNQVYDITQLRFAAEKEKIMFDPAVDEVKPKRDFVRKFLQRLRQDLIYIDTLWLSKSYYPYLAQKRFETSHKLDSVARHVGMDFRKSLTHEELRIVEAKRVAGDSKEIRLEAAQDMIKYSCADLETTKEIIDRMQPYDFLASMKQVLPFCTLSEIAFSSLCSERIWEYLHFKRAGNLPDAGYKAKEKNDKISIFKKRFPKLKNERLKNVGLVKAKGEYFDVMQYYFDLEGSLSDIAFRIYPPLKDAYDKNQKNPDDSFIFSQYLKRFIRPLFADYYFARREELVYKKTLAYLVARPLDMENHFTDFRKRAGEKRTDSIIGSFRYLKNNFRSIYASLDAKTVSLLLPKHSNLFDTKFPKIMESDADLFLLRNRAEGIKGKLSQFEKRTLVSFLHNFNSFEINVEEASEFIPQDLFDPLDFAYSFIYNNRSKMERRRFYARYGIDIREISERISASYKSIAEAIKGRGVLYLGNIGDYLMVDGEVRHPLLKSIRKVDKYIP